MFAKAIRQVANFTSPIHFIQRCYNDTKVNPGSATLFFVNDDGCAITCKHVASLLTNADMINTKYDAFKQAKLGIPNSSRGTKQLKQLEKDYGYIAGSTVIQQKNLFVNSVESFTTIDYISHPKYDLAIIKFNGFDKIRYNGHASFAKDGDAKQPGDFLCRLGFPFCEFSNFTYNVSNDDIGWTKEGRLNSPRFPQEGMFTRHYADQDGVVFGIELSTPGLPGQSGGPLFDENGIIYGMQFETVTYNLGLNVPTQNNSEDEKNTLSKPPTFFHVGHCIHVNIIKEFLKENKVKFFEE